MIDFLFVYEHKVREIDNLCLLCSALELKGYKTDIVNIQCLNLLQYRLTKKPKVIVPYCMYNDETFERIVTDIVGSIKKVVNLHWEQALSEKDIKSGIHIPTGVARDVVHICWGQAGYELLVSHGIKKAILTGAMQMDFLHGSLTQIYESPKELRKKYNIGSKRVILYISTFVYASMTENEKVRFEKTLGYNIDDKIKNNKLVRKTTLDYFHRLLCSDPNYFIIYRPHPGENIDNDLVEFEKKHKNFIINSEYSVKQWIILADEIVTYYSSSVAEVFYAKKNCIILRPYGIREEEDAIIFRGSKITSTYEEFLEELKQPHRNFPIPEDNITNCYGMITDSYVYNKIIDLLEEVLNTNKYDLERCIGYFNIKGPIRRLIKKIILKCKFLLKFNLLRFFPKVKDKIVFLFYINEKFSNEFVSKEYITTRKNLIKNLISQRGGQKTNEQ